MLSANGEQPIRTRLDGGTADQSGQRRYGFKLEEWPSPNVVHDEERVGYVVLRVGVHELSGIGVLECRVVDGADEQWTGNVPIETDRDRVR